MRVLHIISSLDPEHGGPPMTAFRLAVAQAQCGAQVTLAHYEETLEALERIRDASQALPSAGGVVLHSVPRGGKLERVTARAARRALAPLIRAADIVHLHSVWDPIVAAAATVARRLRKPYVVAPHGMLDPWSLSQKSVKKKFALVLRYRAMLDGAAFLHVLNRDEQDLIAPLGLRCPFEVIPNGVFLAEIDRPSPPPSPTDADAAANGKPFVLFLSRLHYKKGLDCLAAAFARVTPKFPDLQLIVAGPDGGEHARFVARVEALGIQSVVHVVGPVYGVSKFALIKKASCFCLPSRQEGFSIAILEALACGVPVVISENCHFPEVGECGAGVVTPLNAPAVGDALAQVAGDADQRERMGRAGRRLVEERFTWEKVAGASLEAYHHAMQAAKSKRRRFAAARRLAGRGLLAALVLLVLAEGIARWGFGLCDPPLLRADANTEYMFRASQHCRQFGNDIIFNSYSMRSPDFPRRKSSPEELRIMVLGDSIVFGGTKIDQRELSTSRLQESLQKRLGRPVVVGNVGCASWGPQNLMGFARVYGFFDADVVVIITSSHDVADVMSFAPIVDRDPSFPSQKPRLALWEIATRYAPRFFAIQREAKSAAAPAQGSTAAEPPAAADVEASMQALCDLIAEAKKAGARVIVAQHSEQSELDGKLLYGHDVIAQRAQLCGVETIQIGPAMKAARDRGEQPYRDFIHPTAAGHAVIAGVLEEAILRDVGASPATAPTTSTAPSAPPTR